MSELYNIFPIKDAETPASIVSFDGAAKGLPITVEAAITPMQSFNGYDHPWAAGAGKSKVPVSMHDYSSTSGVTISVGADGTLTSTGVNGGTGTISLTGNPIFSAEDISAKLVDGQTYFFSGCPAGGSSSTYRISLRKTTNDTSTYIADTGSGASFTYDAASTYLVYININKNVNVDGFVWKPMICLASETDKTWEPYSNICPIIGWTGASIYVSPTQNQSDATTYSVDWTSAAGTVYAGSYESVSGKLKARPQYASYNGETLVGPWLSSMDVYAAGTTPTTGAQVVDLGGTETEYAITQQSIIPIVGQNYVWANCGDINRLQYYVEPDGLVRDVSINGILLHNDGWYMKWRRLSAPKPKFDFIPIYGRDGSIDQTETLGDVFYEDRDVNVDMVYVGEDWNGAYSNLLNAVHGRSCYIQFADDPYWYWSGRLNVSEFDHKSRLLTMAGIVFPYKLNINKNEYSVSVSGATEQTAVELQLAGFRMRVSPEVIVTGTVTLKWGEMTATLSDGTYHVGGLKVGIDGVTIKVWGTGSVTISYREGSL